jgi:hypothetical protein
MQEQTVAVNLEKHHVTLVLRGQQEPGLVMYFDHVGKNQFSGLKRAERGEDLRVLAAVFGGVTLAVLSRGFPFLPETDGDLIDVDWRVAHVEGGKQWSAGRRHSDGLSQQYRGTHSREASR